MSVIVKFMQRYIVFKTFRVFIANLYKDILCLRPFRVFISILPKDLLCLEPFTVLIRLVSPHL